MYKVNRKQFNETAAEWTRSYASGDVNPTENPKVKSLMEMGFTKEQSMNALASCGNNLEEAINYLLSG